jgi:hypothetical protein
MQAGEQMIRRVCISEICDAADGACVPLLPKLIAVPCGYKTFLHGLKIPVMQLA